MDDEKKLPSMQEKKTILIVEDNVMNREILNELLSDDFETLLASNGLEGLSLMEENYKKISIILLDIYMPECNGFEFLEKKSEQSIFQAIPVIVMTASNTIEDEIRCLKLGASDFLSKPYNTEVMKNRIRSIIHLRETSQVLDRLEKDTLTGLNSKEFFFHQAEEFLSKYPEQEYDLICSDIENFRQFNDHYGSTKGDVFLQHLAKQLNEVLPDILLGGRVGADIFTFLIKHQEKGLPEDKLKRIVGNEKPSAIVKFGLVPKVDHALSISTLINFARTALKEIKGHFNNVIGVYDEEFHKKQQRIHLIEESMLPGLQNREFQVYYQPKHSLKDDTIVGAEALVRWVHPQMGFVGPNIFIPLFEHNGFITQLDMYVWEEVCREIRHCLDIGFSIVPISINVSRMDFDLPNLADIITGLADKYNVDHSLIHIELTESMCSENPELIFSTCKKLHDSGITIELDDFGSGYSSLSSLSSMNIDVMKLDVSLIRLASKTKNYSLIRFAIMLAESMKLKTVAEGVETEDQATALRVLGCDYVQGFYFSKPMSQSDFEPYLLEFESSKGEDYFNRIF
ncbi:MAG: EAL domain-containing protein [Desulfovibrionaceae bacterium]|nr:EAL domain-containing protein [Desulfovibrionaceae bacterium]